MAQMPIAFRLQLGCSIGRMGHTSHWWSIKNEREYRLELYGQEIFSLFSFSLNNKK